MKRDTLFLKVVVFLIGAAIIGLCAVGLPWLTNEMSKYYPKLVYFPILISIAASAIPFFIALFQAFKLLSSIDKNKAFSDSSVKSIKSIKYCAITISILYTAVMPIIYLIAEVDDAPGILLIALIMTFASIVIATFAAVLQKLLKNAIEIKSEIDLTV